MAMRSLWRCSSGLTPCPKSWRTKIIYRGRTHLTALFAESGQSHPSLLALRAASTRFPTFSFRNIC
jgi:hypothetical protein